MAKKSRLQELPTAEDFSARAVRKAVLSETLQHPLTIFPAAGALLSGLFMALISVNELAFAALLGGLVWSAGAWVVNFFFRGEEFAQDYLAKMRETRRRVRREEADDLARQCREVGFGEGAKEVVELKAAFVKLHQSLMRHPRDLNAQRFEVLAEDTYYEALRLLRVALDTFKILRNIDVEELRRERETWDAQRQSVIACETADQAQRDLVDALTTKIDSHDKRLTLHADRENQLQRLLAECEVLEAALDAAYMESVGVIGPDVGVSGTTHARELERAVTAARRVEERLRQVQAPSGQAREQAHDRDAIYSEAGLKQGKSG